MIAPSNLAKLVTTEASKLKVQQRKFSRSGVNNWALSTWSDDRKFSHQNAKWLNWTVAFLDLGQMIQYKLMALFEFCVCFILFLHAKIVNRIYSSLKDDVQELKWFSLSSSKIFLISNYFFHLLGTIPGSHQELCFELNFIYIMFTII